MRYDQGDYSTIYDMFALWISEIITVGLSTFYTMYIPQVYRIYT